MTRHRAIRSVPSAELPGSADTIGHGPPADAFRDWHAITVLLLAVAFFFRKILLGQAFLWEDVLYQAYPFRYFAATSLLHGELPLWNPHAFAGMPFQADIQSAVFYIPHLLLTPFAGDGARLFHAMAVMLVAHYALAAVGMFVLARECGLQRIYATFAGLAYALSGFMIVHAIHPGFVEQAAWLPWIMLCLYRALDRRSLRYALGTGLLTGHAVLAGAPQISLYTFLLMAVLTAAVFATAVRRYGVADSLPLLRLAATAAVVALGTAAIQLLPTIELMPLSERDALSFDAAQVGRLEWRQLITVLLPKFFGESSAVSRSWWGPGIYGSYWETCFYWGVPVLLTAVFGAVALWRHPLVRILMGLVFGSFLLAVGDQFMLHGIFYAVVPGFSTFRAPARIMLVATLAVALLSALGLRALVARAREAPRRVEGAAVAMAAIAVFLWFAVRQGAFPAGPTLGAIDLSRQEALIALVLMGCWCLLVVLLTRRVAPAPAVVGALLLFQLADVTRFGQNQNAGSVDVEAHYHATPEHRELVRHLRDEWSTAAFRVTPRDGAIRMLDRNQGMVDGIYLTDGYTPLRLRHRLPPAATLDRSLDLLNSSYRSQADPATLRVRLFRVSTHYPRAMLIPRDTVIADDSTAASLLRRPDFDPARLVVLTTPLAAAPVPDTDTEEASSSRMLDYRANSFQLTVHVPRSGILLLSEIWYPGWRAWVDGRETAVARANGSLRAIRIGAGNHTVAMRFQPVSFRVGMWLSLVTLTLALGGMLHVVPPFMRAPWLQ